jgi:plasmid stabilization system protein ParE
LLLRQTAQVKQRTLSFLTLYPKLLSSLNWTMNSMKLQTSDGRAYWFLGRRFRGEVFDDFDRFFDYIAQLDFGSAPECIGKIMEAVQVLATSSLIGRPVKGGKRELIIEKGSRGYVALYRYVALMDTAFVLAMRSQRKSGCKHKQ